MRHWLYWMLFAITLPVMADSLDIDRIFDGGNLAGPAPRLLKISPDGRYVTFLRGEAEHPNQLDLWAYVPDTGKASILVAASQLQNEPENLSADEKSRRERSRTVDLSGIVDYQWSADGRFLLFPLGGRLYLYELGSGHAQARLLDTGDGDVLDPGLSPHGHYVAYVQNQNLWTLDLRSGQRHALTHDGGGTIHNGEAEFIAQEEMQRSHGYWWAPDDSQIAFERYDEAAVALTQRMEIHTDRSELVAQRYPFAGGPNVAVKLGLVTPSGGPVRWIDLGSQSDIYLTGVRWRPDARVVSYQRMSRNQQQLDLQAVDAHSLVQRTLLTESSDDWINLNDDLRFLPDGCFIWGSERSGYHHLYLYGPEGQLLHPISAGGWAIDELLAVDEIHGKVYFSSNRDAVPDRQIYSLPLDGSTPTQPQRISLGEGTHHAVFSPGAHFYVDTWSNPLTPPQVSLRRPDGHLLNWLEANPLQPGHPFWPYRDSLVTPEFGTLTAKDGQTLYYRIYKPAGFNPQKRYPVFDSFYGGPHAQSVTNAWGDYFNQYMANQGFVVFTLDNRGTSRRGHVFEQPIYQQLGDAEVEDQLTGLNWLKAQPWVDPDRIGVFGWSYGGYLSLMLLAKAGDQIAGGVAVAPVTNWKLYDTFYTERYLGRPQDNPGGYIRSSPMAWLDGMTSKLLLVHGMADDNVLFLNSTELMARLQQQGQSFQLMTYPGGKHGLNNAPGQRRHVYHLVDDFFREQIAHRPARSP
ncbi:S9 family peptidase [Frateuria aurantia]